MKEAINSIFLRALGAAYPIASDCSNPRRLNSRLCFDELKEAVKPLGELGVRRQRQQDRGSRCCVVAGFVSSCFLCSKSSDTCGMKHLALWNV